METRLGGARINQDKLVESRHRFRVPEKKKRWETAIKDRSWGVVSKGASERKNSGRVVPRFNLHNSGQRALEKTRRGGRQAQAKILRI